MVSTGDTLEGIYAAGLWPDVDLPAPFDLTWRSFREEARRDEWAFWIEWYQGMLDGRPMDWDLQRKIALIPDKDWKKGAAHIARIIEEIRARLELTKKLEAAEGKIAQLEAARRGMGGNNPPEPIEDDIYQFALSGIRKSVQDLKEETETDEPDPSHIQVVLEKLRGFLSWIGQPLAIGGKAAILYAGKKADTFLQKFVESFGIAAGPIAATTLAGVGLEIAGVIESAEIWALILKKIFG